MKRILVTGASGTVGTALCRLLQSKQAEVIAWDRKMIPPDDYYRMENFVKLVKPDAIIHLAYASQLTGSNNESWNINYEWTSQLAWITHLLHIRFLFTSTNLVFKSNGPYTLSSVADATEGYGFEKRKAEEQVFHQNPNALIVRLGWQIGRQGSNTMVEFFNHKMREENTIRASTAWLPACSFLEDTCEKLMEMCFLFEPGLYMLDSNERWNICEIATALNNKFNFGWNIEPSEDYIADQRMIDSRVKIHSLKESLSLHC